MKLDIRTTREIMEYNCGSVEALSLFEKKVWVSQESLIKFYEGMWSSGNILSPNEFKQLLKGDEE